MSGNIWKFQATNLAVGSKGLEFHLESWSLLCKPILCTSDGFFHSNQFLCENSKIIESSTFLMKKTQIFKNQILFNFVWNKKWLSQTKNQKWKNGHTSSLVFRAVKTTPPSPCSVPSPPKAPSTLPELMISV